VRLTSQGFSHLRLMRLLPARAPHLDLLWDLLMATPDYSLLITRRLPTRQDAWELLNDCPAGITAQDKLVLAIMDEQHIVGCIDLVRGYPTPETAFLGLLQLRPAAQGQGLGSAMLCEIMAQAAAWHCTRLRLAVIETNGPGLTFWLRHGFCQVGRRSLPQYVGDALLMERAVCHPYPQTQ
jgi:GNAT superfamily N-acetyltransferase